jgi:hypothetical protein
MGKMDTSDLSERYFDENTILYSVGSRNQIIFGEKDEKKAEKKEETITFTPGPGVTAIVHDQNDKAQSANNGEVDGAMDADEQVLVGLWRTYKEDNPKATLDDFCKDVSTTNSEVQ